MTQSSSPEAKFADRVSFVRTGRGAADGAPLLAVDFSPWPGAAELYARFRGGEDLPAGEVTADLVEAAGVRSVALTFRWPTEDVAICVCVPTGEPVAAKALTRLADGGQLALIATEVYEALSEGGKAPTFEPDDRAALIISNLESLQPQFRRFGL